MKSCLLEPWILFESFCLLPFAKFFCLSFATSKLFQNKNILILSKCGALNVRGIGGQDASRTESIVITRVNIFFTQTDLSSLNFYFESMNAITLIYLLLFYDYTWHLQANSEWKSLSTFFLNNDYIQNLTAVKNESDNRYNTKMKGKFLYQMNC